MKKMIKVAFSGGNKKEAKKNSFLFMLLFVCILGACKNEKPHSVLDIFSESRLLSQKKSN